MTWDGRELMVIQVLRHHFQMNSVAVGGFFAKMLFEQLSSSVQDVPVDLHRRLMLSILIQRRL
ncbi:hypothetical protein DP56_627 [Burkholderia pseudomallei]|nr:hypothetical protein DP56_627 [Burkholderia pseudomallei]